AVFAGAVLPPSGAAWSPLLGGACAAGGRINMRAAAPEGGSAAEHAVQYFAVVGSELDGPRPRAGDSLGVVVLQRYPLDDHEGLGFPPALASFCFPRGGATAVAQEEDAPLASTLHGFVLTNETSDRCYGAALHIWEVQPCGSVLVPKALAVVGMQPLWSAFHAFLCMAARTACREALVVNFVAETPLPPPGFSVHVQLQAGACRVREAPLVLRRPAPNQLPLLDLGSAAAAALRAAAARERGFPRGGAAAGERRVVLHSDHLSLLSAVGEMLVGLVWPLRLAAVYVPLLPNALVDFCGAPMPLMVGIDSQMVDRAEAVCEPHTIFVDLDQSRVRTAGGDGCTAVTVDLLSVGGADQGVVGPLPPPPERPHRKLLTRVGLAMQGVDFQARERGARSFLHRPRGSPPQAGLLRRQPIDSSLGSVGSLVRPGAALPWRSPAFGGPATPDAALAEAGLRGFQWPEGSQAWEMGDAANGSHVLAHRDGSAADRGVAPGDPSSAEAEPDALLRSAFLWFMTDLLVDHAKFIGPKHENGFDHAGFLAQRPECDRPFLLELTGTQMWAVWIARRQDRDSKDVLLFDDIINQKLNRKTTTLKKFATPLLNNHFWNCHGSGEYYVVPDPPCQEPGSPPGEEVRGAAAPSRRWALDLARLPAPRPLPNLQASLPLPARAPRHAAHADGAAGRDPLLSQQRAPLQWYVCHCWLLTWAAFLPEVPGDGALLWAKMDVCLGVLHRMVAPAEQRSDWPPPHDLALSLLAAACARCGPARVDLARRLFTWMRARRLGAATHPRSTAVFFERFVQLCASGGPSAPSAPVRRSPAEKSGGSVEKVARMAEARVAEELLARPSGPHAAPATVPAESPLQVGRLTLTHAGCCPKCERLLTVHEVMAQWAKPGAEEASAVRCSGCASHAEPLLHVAGAGAPVAQVPLLHPRRLAASLPQRLGGAPLAAGPGCLAGLAAEDFPAWASLLWHFRAAGLFSQHLAAAALGRPWPAGGGGPPGRGPGAPAAAPPQARPREGAAREAAGELVLEAAPALSEGAGGGPQGPAAVALEALELPPDTPGTSLSKEGGTRVPSTAASTPLEPRSVSREALERLQVDREDLVAQLALSARAVEHLRMQREDRSVSREVDREDLAAQLALSARAVEHLRMQREDLVAQLALSARAVEHLRMQREDRSVSREALECPQVDHEVNAHLWSRSLAAFEPGSFRVNKVPAHCSWQAVLDGRLTEAQRRGNQHADRLAKLGARLHAVDAQTVGEHRALAGFVQELARWVGQAAVIWQDIVEKDSDGFLESDERQRVRFADHEERAELPTAGRPTAQQPRVECVRSVASVVGLSITTAGICYLGHSLAYACCDVGEEPQELVACSRCGAYMVLGGRSGGRPKLKEPCVGERATGQRSQRRLWARGLHPGGRPRGGDQQRREKGAEIPALRLQGPLPPSAQEAFLAWLGLVGEVVAGGGPRAALLAAYGMDEQDLAERVLAANSAAEVCTGASLARSACQGRPGNARCLGAVYGGVLVDVGRVSPGAALPALLAALASSGWAAEWAEDVAGSAARRALRRLMRGAGAPMDGGAEAGGASAAEAPASTAASEPGERTEAGAPLGALCAERGPQPWDDGGAAGADGCSEISDDAATLLGLHRERATTLGSVEVDGTPSARGLWPEMVISALVYNPLHATGDRLVEMSLELANINVDGSNVIFARLPCQLLHFRAEGSLSSAAKRG
ncbi:unnamed protein product, partial [Prorocentrum cordatum]